MDSYRTAAVVQNALYFKVVLALFDFVMLFFGMLSTDLMPDEALVAHCMLCHDPIF